MIFCFSLELHFSTAGPCSGPSTTTSFGGCNGCGGSTCNGCGECIDDCAVGKRIIILVFKILLF